MPFTALYCPLLLCAALCVDFCLFFGFCGFLLFVVVFLCFRPGFLYPWCFLGSNPAKILKPARGMLDGGAGVLWLQRLTMRVIGHLALEASLAQLAEHALRERMVVGSIPTGGLANRAASEHACELPC